MSLEAWLRDAGKAFATFMSDNVATFLVLAVLIAVGFAVAEFLAEVSADRLRLESEDADS